MLPEEFKEFVSRLFSDQYGEYAKKRHEESRAERERIAYRTSGMAVGAIQKAESDALLDIQGAKGDQLWQAMREALDAFSFEYYPELPKELLEFGTSLLPEQTPRPPSGFAAQQLPDFVRNAQMGHLQQGFMTARIKAINTIRNNIDIYCRKMQKSPPPQGMNVTVNAPISGQMNVAGHTVSSPSLHITLAELQRQIEEADASEEQKTSALQKLQELLKHPLVNTIVGAFAGVVAGGAA